MLSTILSIAIAASPANRSIEHRVDVEAVVRDCSIFDADDCLVTTPPGLTVHTRTGSVPCEVSRLDSPVRVVLVRDRSFSIIGRMDRTIRRTFDLILKALADLTKDHQVAVLEFDEVQEWKTNGFVSATTAIKQIEWAPTDGGTNLWAGIKAALDVVAANPSTLKTVLVVASDGADRGTRDTANFERVRERVREMNLPVYYLGFPPKRLQEGRIVDPDGDESRRCFKRNWRSKRSTEMRMVDLAEVAGGGAIFPTRESETAEIVRFLLAEVLGRFRVEAEGEIGIGPVTIAAPAGYKVRCNEP